MTIMLRHTLALTDYPNSSLCQAVSPESDWATTIVSQETAVLYLLE